jgi:hypothetical protein
MELHRWWQAAPNERYWLEITRRPDIGQGLRAPQTRENGTEFWGYSLLREVRDSDVVFHYDQSQDAIVAVSRATGEPWSDDIIWAARGTSARRAGTAPHTRPGWHLGLTDTVAVSPLVSRDDLAAHAGHLAAIYAAIVTEHGSPSYEPFTVYASGRKLTPAQAYLAKLPASVVELFPQLARAARTFPTLTEPAPRTAVPHANQVATLDTPYREADEEAAVAARDPFAVDPAIVERGLLGHARTQNALARYVAEHGGTPRSPGPGEPPFDVAWQWDGVDYVAEVKSLTASNEERQLRLGLGQVLRYRHLLSTRGKQVVAVLAVEKKPCDDSWAALCRDLDVVLCWPESFSSSWHRVRAEQLVPAVRRAKARP